jgi:hypothetical protein
MQGRIEQGEVQLHLSLFPKGMCASAWLTTVRRRAPGLLFSAEAERAMTARGALAPYPP